MARGQDSSHTVWDRALQGHAWEAIPEYEEAENPASLLRLYVLTLILRGRHGAVPTKCLATDSQRAIRKATCCHIQDVIERTSSLMTLGYALNGD